MSKTYTVKAGDTLSRIAAAQGSTTAAIAAANRITNPNLIRVGQVLMIPGATVAPIAQSAVVGITQAPVAEATKPGSWWDTVKAGFSNPGDLIRSIGETYGAVAQTRLNEKLGKINIKRVESGQDPLDPAIVRDIAPAPRVEVGLEQTTRDDLMKRIGTPLLLGGLGLGALFVFTRNSSPPVRTR